MNISHQFLKLIFSDNYNNIKRDLFASIPLPRKDTCLIWI